MRTVARTELPLALSAAGSGTRRCAVRGAAGREKRGSIALPTGNAGISYRKTAEGVDVLAHAVTGATKRGSLPVSLGAIVIVLVPSRAMLIKADTAPGRRDPCAAGQLIIYLVVLGIATATVRVKRGLTAVMMVGGVAMHISVLFILRGAPDLALATQILVETAPHRRVVGAHPVADEPLYTNGATAFVRPSRLPPAH